MAPKLLVLYGSYRSTARAFGSPASWSTHLQRVELRPS
jgi:hypothetical protein